MPSLPRTLTRTALLRSRRVTTRPMSSPDSPRDRSRSPKHAEERERRPRSPKHAGERSRSPKRDSTSGHCFNEERPRAADGPGERTHEPRKLEWRREPARPRGSSPVRMAGGSQPRGRMNRPPDSGPRHATSGGEQPRARQVERSRPTEPTGSSSNRREPGRWTERKPAAAMGTGGWSHDDRQERQARQVYPNPNPNRQAAGSNGQASAGRADVTGGNRGRSDQVDRWQRDMFKGPTAGRVTAVDESRRSAFANFEF